MLIEPTRRGFACAIASLALTTLTVAQEKSAAPVAGAATSDTVVVFAAASLKNALDAAGAKWMPATGKKVTFSYAASGPLAKQIESGAPADLFVSADLKWMDYAAERKGIRPESRKSLLGNGRSADTTDGTCVCDATRDPRPSRA